jgi:hypothetical protein
MDQRPAKLRDGFALITPFAPKKHSDRLPRRRAFRVTDRAVSDRLAAMLDKLKSCFKVWTFCRNALVEDCKRWRWCIIVRIAFQTLNKFVQNILGLGVIALLLGFVYRYRETLLTHKRWCAIVLLSFITAFLLWLIGAIKRFHERTINRSVWIAEQLSSRAAGLEEHFIQRKTPADKEFLEAWLNGAAHDIKDYLGLDALKGFYDGLDAGKPPPDTLDAQRGWMRKYTGKLRFIVKDQYIPIPPVRLSRKQRKAADLAQASARAWAAKQKPRERDNEQSAIPTR